MGMAALAKCQANSENRFNQGAQIGCQLKLLLYDTEYHITQTREATI